MKITNKENEALLRIFKDFDTNYNANSLSKKLKITPRGALKILKNLYADKILIRKQMGKAIFYKINFSDEYAKKLLETSLIREAREKALRWVSEFQELSKPTHLTIIFGSALKNYDKAKDIDLLLAIPKNKYKEISKFIDEKNKVMLKPIHPVTMTLNDLEKNLKNKNPAMINAIKEGYVLAGYEKIIKVINNVTSF